MGSGIDPAYASCIHTTLPIHLPHPRLQCCFLEIYNECITDLLNPAATNLAVREDLRRGVYVEGLAEAEVTSGEQGRTAQEMLRPLHI